MDLKNLNSLTKPHYLFTIRENPNKKREKLMKGQKISLTFVLGGSMKYEKFGFGGFGETFSAYETDGFPKIIGFEVKLR